MAVQEDSYSDKSLHKLIPVFKVKDLPCAALRIIQF